MILLNKGSVTPVVDEYPNVEFTATDQTNLVETGIICGANIKAINQTADGFENIGVFIHIRMDNGDQLDYIAPVYTNAFRHECIYGGGMYSPDGFIATFETTPKSLDLLGMSRKNKIKIGDDGHQTIVVKKIKPYKDKKILYPILLNVLKACGVKEWVDLIGTKVLVRRPKVVEEYIDKAPFYVSPFAISPFENIWDEKYRLIPWFIPPLMELFVQDNWINEWYQRYGSSIADLPGGYMGNLMMTVSIQEFFPEDGEDEEDEEATASATLATEASKKTEDDGTSGYIPWIAGAHPKKDLPKRDAKGRFIKSEK